MAKSNKLYAVLVVDKAQFRDDLLDDLFDSPRSKKFTYMTSSTYQISTTDFLGNAKTWKTELGAKRSLKKRLKQIQDRIANGRYYYGLKPDNYRFEIVEVDRDKWNSYIDGEVLKVKNKMDRIIRAWNLKKIS